MTIYIKDLLKSAKEYSISSETVWDFLYASPKYKDTIKDKGFKGVTVEGDLNEILAELKQTFIVDEEKKQKEEEARKRKLAEELGGGKEPIFDLIGVRGRNLKVFDDRVAIKVDVTAGAILTGNMTDGTKVIFFKDVIGIQFRETTTFVGYLQFETASGLMNNAKDNMWNENTFTYMSDKKDNPNDVVMRNVFKYVTNQVAEYKQLDTSNNYSPADEIRKFKELLEQGAITNEEYMAKKAQLLNE